MSVPPPADPPAAAADPAGTATRIAAGYATDQPAVLLGTVVVDGVVDPSAQVQVPLSMLTRHGLVAGATGTGKTKTLQLLAEQLSAAGVPVLMPDVKGDLTGLSAPGRPDARTQARAADTGDRDWTPTGVPVEYLSLAGQGTGVPVRATLDSFGPILLSKVLDLNETQESTLGLIFHWADSRNLPLLDVQDLRAVITHLTSDEGKADLQDLGGVSRSTAGVILRAVTNLAAQGGDTFFGEPQLDVADLLRTTPDGRGIVTLLEVAELRTNPALFSTFLMWLLAELFEALPEVGDVERPKLVFLFDEAHLLFADASKAFRQAVEQTVKLIRSKGVGVFFSSQLPTDIPGPVLSQLGARVQHALRAFTPDDQKALAATVRTYPTTRDYDLSTALTGLGIGEAVVTVLSERGAPTPVAWTRVRAPRSLMGPADPAGVTAAVAASPLQSRYGTAVDRESAYEMLAARLAPQAPPPVAGPAPTDELPPVILPPITPPPARRPSRPDPRDSGGERPPSRTRHADREDAGPASGLGDLLNPAVGSFLRSLGSAMGGSLGRSVFGTRRRRR
ncbi:helicase HerA-like domain-containing protein [Nakamurella endophytica]|uniref:ATPase n=1 Tax=Nakamurella endophytica TaxID=1748367 RepID=A0A917T2Q0_9ACTN|nr:helicase HerA-like domain-containing protein [Nakamurella endophytica]GGM07074.1 ATPase [Nakamurella endophytica]